MKRILCVLLCLSLMFAAGCMEKKTPAAQESAAEKTEVVRGVWEGNAYVSEYASLRMELPKSGWQHADEEALERMTQYDENGVITSLTDVTAQTPDGKKSIIVMFENLGRSEETADVTAGEYAQIIADGLESMEDIDYTVEGIAPRTLCGKEYTCVEGTVKASGREQLYFARREGSMMVVVIVTGENADALLNLFKE